MDNERVWTVVDEWSDDEGSGSIICGVYDSEELAVKEARTILRKRKKNFKDFNPDLASSFVVRINSLRNKGYKCVSYTYTNSEGYRCLNTLIVGSHPINRTVVC